MSDISPVTKKMVEDFVPNLEDRPLSFTSGKNILKSPRHYVEYILGPRYESDALAFGNLVHVIVLEPHLFKKQFQIIDEECKKAAERITKEREAEGKATKDVTRTKAYQEWLQAFKDNAAESKTILVTQAEVDKAEAMRDAIYENPMAQDKLELSTEFELTYRWRDKKIKYQKGGDRVPINLIGKVDFQYTREDQEIMFIGDLKTVPSADEDDFNRSISKYKYHIQAAMYLDAIRWKKFQFPEFYFILVEKTPPYGVNVVQLDNHWIELGKQELEKIKKRFVYAYENRLWHQSYEFLVPETVPANTCHIPGYMRNKIEQ